MVVPLLKHHFCRRGDTGPKAHAHAAYLSGTKLNGKNGRTADFTPKGGIRHAELWVPNDAPSWAKDRGELWRRLEEREDKSTRPDRAIVAHKFIGALPHELSLEENIRLVKDFVREQFTRKGYAADWAIHAPDPGSDSRNYHVHIMVPLRKFENGNWAKLKDRFPKNSPALSQYIKGKQEAFFELQNRYLKKNGHEARIERINGKWSVANGPTSPYGRSPTRTSHPTHAQKPGYVAQPKIRPSQAPTLGGGSEGGTSLRQILSQAAKKAVEQSNANAPKSIPNVSTGGWPPAAIRDWNDWGHKDPARFFAIWPELGRGGPRP
jgi:hypothetical protein